MPSSVFRLIFRIKKKKLFNLLRQLTSVNCAERPVEEARTYVELARNLVVELVRLVVSSQRMGTDFFSSFKGSL